MAGTGRGRRLRDDRRRRGRHGAAPLVFADSVACRSGSASAAVYAIFAEAGLHDDVMFIGAGKLGLPDNAVVAFALGADMVNVGREAMLAIGCIQAQKCHTDRCPTGVATQNPWLARGLDPALKSVRCANYVRTLRRDLLKLAEATRGRAPRADRDRRPSRSSTARPRHARCTRSTGTTRVGLPVGRGPRRDRPPDDGDGPARHRGAARRRDSTRLGRHRLDRVDGVHGLTPVSRRVRRSGTPSPAFRHAESGINARQQTYGNAQHDVPKRKTRARRAQRGYPLCSSARWCWRSFVAGYSSR